MWTLPSASKPDRQQSTTDHFVAPIPRGLKPGTSGGSPYQSHSKEAADPTHILAGDSNFMGTALHNSSYTTIMLTLTVELIINH